MPDNLQLYENRQNQVENDQLGQAMHAADWTSTFNQPNSTENLRAQRNVTDMVAQALDRKQQLAMQTDANAARIYQINQASRIAAEQAPLRDQLLRAQIGAQGATSALQAQKEIDTLNDHAGFANYMLNAPEINDPAYHNYVVTGMGKFPHILTTAEGQKELLNHGKAHDAAMAVPQGSVATLAHVGPEGPSYNVRPSVKEGEFSSPAEVNKWLQQNNETGSVKRNPDTGGWYAETLPKTTAKDQRTVIEQHGMTSGQFAHRIGTEQVNDEMKPDYNGNFIKVKILNSDGKPMDKIVPREDFQAMGGTITPKPSSIPESASKYLKEHPETAKDFDSKYGDGASAGILK